MSNLDAALGVAQFERANELIAKKREIFGWYQEELSDLTDISMNAEPEGTKNLFWMPSVIFGDSYSFDRDALIKGMNADGIGIRPFFYPVSMFPMFESAKDNVVSWSLYKRGINLPSYHDMTRDEITIVCNALRKNIDYT